MENERLQILKMVQDGKISAEEAGKLLLAVDGAGNQTVGVSGGAAKWLRVKVTDLNSGKAKVNVNLPLSLLEVGLSIAMKFVPEDALTVANGVDMKQVIAAVRSGAMGKLVEVEDEDEGVRVEISVE